jgi:hypothetical protein
MQSSYARPWTIAGLVVTLVQLNLNPQSQREAEQQLNDVAKETRALTDHYLEEHRQQESIDALHDIEDAIIFNGLNDGND